VGGKAREGLVYGLIAYGWWGMVPLYFRALGRVPPMEVLAHRICWSMILLGAVLALSGRWRGVGDCFRQPALRRTLLLTAALIALNWFAYIMAVYQKVIVHASLGYFLTPLVNVLLGMIVFKERLRRLQGLAVLLALGGTTYLIVAEKSLPWIALTLAISFSLYGLFRKKIPVDGLVGLSVETIILLPIAAGYLVYLGTHEALSLGTVSWSLDLLLLASGVVTAVPLLCFGQAAQRLPLSTLGFLQYISPSIQFLLAVGVLGEPMNIDRLLSFTFIWLGLIVFTVDSVRAYRKALLRDSAASS
jgi:chloramphenicol-sensitive protein RarD